MSYQVIVIEDHQEISDSIVATLKNSPDFVVAASYKNGNAAINQSKMFNPNLFLIDAEDSETLEMIPAFVETFPKADILGFVSHWIPDSSRAMQRAGALGNILRPFNTSDIIEAIKIYKTRGKTGLARVISFFSPKGRAGRTTMAAILALALAERSGERVALIDADLQFGDMPMFFDVEPKQTAVDATQDVKLLTPLTLEPYFYNLKKNLYLLSIPDRPEYAELVEIESMVDVVRMSCNIFRYVLMDLPAGFNPLSIGLSRLADTVIVMAMINNGFEIQHVNRTLKMFKSFATDQKKVYPVFTRVNPCTEEEKLKIEAKLGYTVSDIIPNEYKMISIANSGRLSKGLPMDSQLMQIISRIADDIIAGKR